jgi:hypothetical protein
MLKAHQTAHMPKQPKTPEGGVPEHECRNQVFVYSIKLALQVELGDRVRLDSM